MPGDTRAAVAQRDQQTLERVKNFDAFVAGMGEQMRRVLPKWIPEERMVRIAMSAARSNSRLLDCTEISVAGSLLSAATLGLEPNTALQECYLVPYRDKQRGITEAQLIIGYHGIVKLFLQHPQAVDCDAQAVYPEDEFWYRRGTDPMIHHVPSDDRAEDSSPTHYYGLVWTKGMVRPHFEVLTADQVKKLRRGKEGPSGDIPDPQRWMERKTALKQSLKLAPKSTVLATAIENDERSGTELYRDLQRTSAQRLDVPGAIEGNDGGQQPPDDRPPVEDPPPGGEGL